MHTVILRRWWARIVPALAHLFNLWAIWIRNHQPLDISALSPIIAAILSALPPPAPGLRGADLHAAGRFCIWATLLSPCCITLQKVRMGGSREAQFSGQSWIQLAPIQGKILFRPPVSVQMGTHVGFGFTTEQANHAAQADSPQIKPGGRSALFLELMKWWTCCSRQF